MDGRVDRGWGRWKETGRNYELWTDIKRYGKKMERREEQMERKTWMEDVGMEDVGMEDVGMERLQRLRGKLERWTNGQGKGGKMKGGVAKAREQLGAGCGGRRV